MQCYTHPHVTLLHKLVCLTCLLFSHQSKRRRTHTQTQSSSPWKKTTALLWNTGERKCCGLWSPQSPFYPSTPAPSLLCAQVCSLWLGWSSAPSPSSQPLQLTNKWPRITTNRIQNKKSLSPQPFELLPPWSTRFFFFLGFGTFWMRLVLDLNVLYVLDMTLWCHLIGFFRFKGFRGLGVLKL